MNNKRKSILSGIIFISLVLVIGVMTAYPKASMAFFPTPEAGEVNSNSIYPAADKLELVSQIGGDLRKFAISGSYAYVAEGARLTILDISNPMVPTVVGKSQVMGELIRDMAVSADGNYVYLALGSLGIQVVDCSIKTQPVFKGNYSWGAETNQVVTVSNDYLYAVDSSNKKVWVINIQNPNSPYAVGGSALLNHHIIRLKVSSPYAYAITEGNTFLTFDINGSNITQPSLINTLNLSGLTNPLTGGKDFAIDASTTPSIAYVIGVEGLRKIDLSTYTQVGFYAPTGLQMEAVYADPTESLILIGAENYGLQVLDTALNLMGTFTAVPPYQVTQVSKAGRYAYVKDQTIGMRIISIPLTWISTPRTLNQVGLYHLFTAKDIAIRQSNAYIASQKAGMNIVSIANEASPSYVANYATLGTAMGVKVPFSTAYLTTFNTLASGGLERINITNPTFPTIIGVPIAIPGNSVSNVDVEGNYAYAAASTEGLQVVLLGSTPSVVASFKLGDTPAPWAYDVKKNGSYAYVAYGQRGLRIVNIPASPSGSLTESGFYDTPGDARSVAIEGSRAYVADGANGVQVIDITNPSNPQLLKNIPLLIGEAQSVLVSNGYAYVAAGSAGVRVFSVSDLSQGSEVGYYNTAGFASRLALSNNILYVADGEGGVLALRIAVAATSTPTATMQTATSTATSQLTPTITGTATTPSVMLTISGRVLDHNGIPLADVSISNGTQTVSTDVNGNYVMIGVPPGTYTLTATKSGYTFIAAFPNPVSVTNANLTGCDFVGVPSQTNRYYISGRIVESGSGNPVAGVTVTDGTRTAISNSNGLYVITNVPAGDYVIQPSKEGFSFSPASMNVAVPPNASGRDFQAAVNPIYSVSGRVTNVNGEPVSGVLITDGSGRNTTTDSNGNYRLSGLPAGPFTITPSKQGYLFNPATITGSVPPNAIDKNFIAITAPLYSISGRVVDQQGNPVAQVTIMDEDGRTTLTDESGTYLLENIPEGRYTIRPSKAGYIFSPESLSGSVPPNATGQNFTALTVVILTPTATSTQPIPPTYSVSGLVKDSQGSPLAGITVKEDGNKYITQTDANGQFELKGLPAGTYAFSAGSAAYVCTPSKVVVTLPPDAAIQFTCTPALYSIKGRVTDAYGSPISGVTLSDGKGHSAVTGMNGTFVITGLTAGSYEIVPFKAEYIFAPTKRTLQLPPSVEDVNFYGTSGVIELIVNGNMEKNEAWVMPYERAGYAMETGAEVRLELTPFPPLTQQRTLEQFLEEAVAAYDNTVYLSGTRSLRIGITDKTKNVLSYSTARQKVYIPPSAKCASLRYWLYPQSVVGTDGADYQMVSMLDENLTQMQRVQTLRSDARMWQFNEATLDVNKFRGKTVWVYFGVFNDGYNSAMAMYVDDVSLLICLKDLPPLPPSTNTPSAPIPTATPFE